MTRNTGTAWFDIVCVCALKETVNKTLNKTLKLPTLQDSFTAVEDA